MPVIGANYGETYVPKKPSTYKAPVVSKPKIVTKPVTKVPSYKPASTPVVSKPSLAVQSSQTLEQLMKSYLASGTSDTNKIYDQQKITLLQQAKAQRDAALGKINQQKTETAQSFYGQRNQADVVNAQNVKRLRELMAANGIASSGENITMNAQANSDRMNSLNALNLEEQSKMRDYANQITDLNNPAKDQAAIAQIESDRAKALVDAKNTATEKAWRQYTFNNMSASEKATLAWAKQQYGEDAAWKMYELQYNGEIQKSTNQAQLGAYTGFNGSQGGGGTAQFQSDMSKAIQRGVPASYASIMTEIAKRESSWNPKALNKSSGTYGYGQFQEYNVDSYNKKYGLDYRNNPSDQLVAMYHYIKDRYGTPENALAFWNKHQWY